MKVFLIVFSAFVIVIALNVLMYKLLVYTVVKNYIKPYFINHDLKLEKYHFTGFFDIGAYGKRELEIMFIPQSGNIFNDTYINLLGIDKNSTSIKYTAKISTVFFIIKRVEIKQENTDSIRLKRR